MNFKRIIAALLTVVMLMSVSVFAEEVTKPGLAARVDNSTKQVTVEGKSYQFDGTAINIIVWKPDKSVANVGAETLEAVSAYVGSTTVGDATANGGTMPDGKDFVVKFKLPEDAISGVYTVTAGIPGYAQNIYTQTFPFSNWNDMREAIQAFQAGNEADGLAKYNGIDANRAKAYSGFNATQQTYVKNQVDAIEATFPTEDVSASDPEAVAKTINTGLADGTGNAGVGKLIDNVIKTKELAAATVDTDANAILEAERTNNWFGLDFTTYDTLTDGQKELARSLIMQASANLVLPTNVLAEFNTAVITASQTDTEIPPQTEAGTGSAGGGGGGGGTVSVAPELIPGQPGPSIATGAFVDLAGVDWARNAINVLATKGVINGKSATEFCPNDNITREELLKLLMVGFEVNTGIKERLPFNDVVFEDWYYDVVVNAYSAKIVNGVSADSFGVGQPITRQDMVTMLAKTLEYTKMALAPLGEEKPEFTDAAEIADYAATHVEAMTAAGIINGMGDGTFAPNAPATRAEAAVILHRVLYKLGKI